MKSIWAPFALQFGLDWVGICTSNAEQGAGDHLGQGSLMAADS